MSNLDNIPEFLHKYVVSEKEMDVIKLLDIKFDSLFKRIWDISKYYETENTFQTYYPDTYDRIKSNNHKIFYHNNYLYLINFDEYTS